MKSDGAIDEFLQQQTAEGARDSEGVFTIDLKVAKRKLAAFQLPTAQSWMLVLVQAAHRGGATQFKVTQLSRQTTIRISGSESWAWSELQAVLDGEPTSNGAVLAYATVVRALSGLDEVTSFRVKSPDGTSAHWRGEEFRLEYRRIEDVLLDDMTVLEVNYLGKFPKKRSPFIEVRRCAREQLVALQQALVNSCYVSSVPILVDGLEIPALHRRRPTESNLLAFPLAIPTIADYRVPSVTLTASMEAVQKRLPDAPISLSSRGLDREEPVGAVACLSLLLRQHKSLLSSSFQLEEGANSSRWIWVQDGIVVGSHSLPISGALELSMVVSAAGLQTDLSGLELVQSPELEQRKALAVELMTQRLKELADECLSENGEAEDRPDRFGLGQVLSEASSSFPWLGQLLSAGWSRQADQQRAEQLAALRQDLLSLPARLQAAAL